MLNKKDNDSNYGGNYRNCNNEWPVYRSNGCRESAGNNCRYCCNCCICCDCSFNNKDGSRNASYDRCKHFKCSAVLVNKGLDLFEIWKIFNNCTNLIGNNYKKITYLFESSSD